MLAICLAAALVWVGDRIADWTDRIEARRLRQLEDDAATYGEPTREEVERAWCPAPLHDCSPEWCDADCGCPPGECVQIPPDTMATQWAELGEAVNRLTEALREALEDTGRRVSRLIARTRERLTR